MLPLDAGHEIGRSAIAIRMRGVGGADAIRRIAAQRHDMADADVVIAADDIVDLAARRANAGQMRGRRSPVSVRMRAMVEWVRSRVDPPAP